MTDTRAITKARQAGTQLSDAVRSARVQIAGAADSIMRDLAIVQGRAEIAAAMTDDVKALILAAGKQGHYELITGDRVPIVSPDAIVAVVVQAYVHGLSLTGSQFAVWPKRDKTASLYIKAAGYRQMFANSGRSSGVDVHLGFPEFRPLQPLGSGAPASDKAVAQIEGAASCVWDGSRVEVTAHGDYRVALPCYATDNVDGLLAKAERRLLARLWHKCSGELIADPEQDSDVIEVQPAEAAEEHRDVLAAYRDEYRRLDSQIAKDIYRAVMEAETVDQLHALDKTDRSAISAKDSLAIGRAISYRMEQLDHD